MIVCTMSLFIQIVILGSISGCSQALLIKVNKYYN